MKNLNSPSLVNSLLQSIAKSTLQSLATNLIETLSGTKNFCIGEPHITVNRQTPEGLNAVITCGFCNAETFMFACHTLPVKVSNKIVDLWQLHQSKSFFDESNTKSCRLWPNQTLVLVILRNWAFHFQVVGIGLCLHHKEIPIVISDVPIIGEVHHSTN